MKIKRLTLSNFSSHVASTVPFDKPISIVVGSLNAGKSSLLQAIEYALCGVCSYYRKRTDDRSELLYHSDKMASESMMVDLLMDVGHIRRTRAADRTETYEWNTQVQPTVSALDTKIADALRVPKTVVSAVLNTTDFFSLEPADQKELVIGLIGAEITDEKVRALFTAEPEALQMIGTKLISLVHLQNAYDYAYSRRTDVGRELKELKPPDPPEGPAPPIDRIRALLTQYETELQGMIGDKGRLEGSAAGGNGRQAMEIRKAALQKALKDVPTEQQKAGLKKNLEAAVEAHDAAIREADKITGATMNLQAQIVSRESNIKLLTKFNGRCVAGDHPCPAPAADMAAALVSQQASQKELAEKWNEAQQRMKDATRKRDDLTPIRQAETALNECASLMRVSKQYEEELKQLEKELAKPAPVQPDLAGKVTELETKIADMRKRITTGRAKLEEAASWIERSRQVAAVAERRRTLEIEHRHLDSLCQFFGPKGVKVQLIDERVNRFVETINRYLQAFEFQLTMTVDPWQISARGRPLNRLSDSERFRLGVAFQIAIAKMTGLNIVVCDRTEMLTPQVFAKMMHMLMSAELDQVILIKTLMVPVEQFMNTRPKIEQLEYFLVDNKDGVSSVQAV